MFLRSFSKKGIPRIPSTAASFINALKYQSRSVSSRSLAGEDDSFLAQVHPDMDVFKNDLKEDREIKFSRLKEKRAIKTGDIVRLHYTGSYIDPETGKESIFDRCTEKDEEEDGPSDVMVGDPTLLPGLSQGLVGLRKGEKKKFEVPCVEAFGEYDIAKVFGIKRSKMPEDVKAGMVFDLSGRTKASVIEVQEDQVLMDANHGLAGFDIVFDVEIVDIFAPKLKGSSK